MTFPLLRHAPLLIAALGAQTGSAAPLPPAVKENAIGAGAIYTDPRGMTLYTSERDKPRQSACNAACAKVWPPLAATADAAPVGDWSPIARDDGSRQWALKGRPVYTYAKDASPGNAYGDGAGNYAWRVVFVPIPTPTGFSVRTSLLGYVLADAHGLTLYTRDDEKDGKVACTGACLESWSAFAAPLMASASGPWGIVVRPDGSHQWSYRGHPLYSFAEDQKVRDTHGHGRDKVWHAAILTPAPGRPTWVTVQPTDMGPVFADATGHTLYTGPDDQKMVNKLTCDEACIAGSVHVVSAEKDAKGMGDWSVVTGAKGTVWAYRGSPVYTYAQDRGPGDVRGDKWAASLGAAGWEPLVANIGGDEVP